jgi:hypothetical protein
VGTARVLLPEAIRKIVGRFLENGEFAPSTPNGSFSQKALNDVLMHTSWADGVLLAGDLGRNSETAILLEKFLAKSVLPVTLTKDVIDYVTTAPHIILERSNTLLVLSFSQLQRLGISAKSPIAITFSMDLLHLVEWLHDFTTTYKPYIVVKHLDNILVAVNGQVNTTKLAADMPLWRIKAAAHASVWWLQNSTKPLQGITAGIASLGQ